MVVGSSAHNDKLDPAPGLLNERQRCELELPCGAWVGFSSRQPPASNTNNGFCPGGAGHGGQDPLEKHLPTNEHDELLPFSGRRAA